MNYDVHLSDRKAAEAYESDLITKKHYYLSLMHSLEEKTLRDVLKRYNINKCLDFACGTGRITKVIDENCQVSFGADISQEAINIAKKKCSRTKFYCGNFLESGLPVKDLDAITSFRFLLNTPHREQAFSMIKRSIRPGGYLIFDIHRNLTSFRGLVVRGKQLVGLDKNKNTLSYFEAKKLLEKNGFKLLHYYGIGALPHYGNFTFLPKRFNTKIEEYITHYKLFRRLCFDVVYVCKKI